MVLKLNVTIGDPLRCYQQFRFHVHNIRNPANELHPMTKRWGKSTIKVWAEEELSEKLRRFADSSKTAS